MVMDILEYLKKRQSELEYKGHPMSERMRVLNIYIVMGLVLWL